MASGDNTVKWPGPVTFDDNNPSTGKAKLHLKIPELKTSGLAAFGNVKAKNADVDPKITKEHVCITVSIHGGATYRYDKQLPEDIDHTKSKCKLKEGKVEVILHKAKDVSWGAHSKDMIKKPSEKKT